MFRSLAALALAAGLAADAAAQLRAGAFAQDVTPDRFPVSVNGHFTDRQVSTVSDRLHARCLVLADGTTQLALVVVDSCMLPRELLDAAKEKAAKATGIPAANMMVSATHTHTAPTVAGIFQSEPDARYAAFLTERIAAGITKAHANLAPAEIAWGTAPEPGQLFNRRWWTRAGAENRDPFGGTRDLVKMNPGNQNPALLAPAGPIDPDVSVLFVRSPAGRPLALYANYSLHYVGDRPALSADYFGQFCELVGGKVGADGGEPKFVGLLSNGTSADVNNVNFAQPPLKAAPGERSRAVAEAVATAAGKAVAGAKFTSRVRLVAATAELDLGVRKPTPEELRRAEQLLSAAGGRELKTPDEVYARETVLLAKYPDRVRLPVQAVRIGEVGLVGIPCEVFTEIGLTLKRRSPLKPTVNVSLANGYNGYLPTPHQHSLGGYETWRARSSYLETTASDRITAASLELLNGVTK